MKKQVYKRPHAYSLLFLLYTMKNIYYYLAALISSFIIFLLLLFKEEKYTTWNPKNEAFIKKLHPKIRKITTKFINKVEKELSIQLRITYSLRTFAEQDALYAKGRTISGRIVTNAKGGRSYHNYGLAVDFFDTTNQTFHISQKTAQIGEKLGFEWGGHGQFGFVDKPHFQKTFGKSWRELLKMHNSGQTDSNNYVKLERTT